MDIGQLAAHPSTVGQVLGPFNFKPFAWAKIVLPENNERTFYE